MSDHDLPRRLLRYAIDDPETHRECKDELRNADDAEVATELEQYGLEVRRIALTDVDCLRVDKTDFEGILKNRPEMAQEISAILAQRRVELTAAREDAATRNSRIFTERGRILSAIKDFFALERD